MTKCAIPREFYIDLSDLPDNLAAVVTYLANLLASIPPQYQAVASFDTQDDYDTGFSRYAYVRWVHVETDAEEQARETEAAQAAAARRAAKARRDRAAAEAKEKRDAADYARLKAKYEGTP